MTNEDIFMEAEYDMFPNPYDYEIKLIGKEKYLKFISEFGGNSLFFPHIKNLTCEPSDNVTEEYISNLKISDLYSPYDEIAKVIGIDALYKLCRYNRGSTKYIPKLEYLIINIKKQLSLAELLHGKKKFEISRKYKLSERTIQNILTQNINKDYCEGKEVSELSKKYKIDEKYIKKILGIA